MNTKMINSALDYINSATKSGENRLFDVVRAYSTIDENSNGEAGITLLAFSTDIPVFTGDLDTAEEIEAGLTDIIEGNVDPDTAAAHLREFFVINKHIEGSKELFERSLSPSEMEHNETLEERDEAYFNEYSIISKANLAGIDYRAEREEDILSPSTDEFHHPLLDNPIFAEYAAQNPGVVDVLKLTTTTDEVTTQKQREDIDNRAQEILDEREAEEENFYEGDCEGCDYCDNWYPCEEYDCEWGDEPDDDWDDEGYWADQDSHNHDIKEREELDFDDHDEDSAVSELFSIIQDAFGVKPEISRDGNGGITFVIDLAGDEQDDRKNGDEPDILRAFRAVLGDDVVDSVIAGESEDNQDDSQNENDSDGKPKSQMEDMISHFLEEITGTLEALGEKLGEEKAKPKEDSPKKREHKVTPPDFSDYLFHKIFNDFR